MRLLLDTHILLAIARQDLHIRYPRIAQVLNDQFVLQFGSVASIWEVAIKVRIGKLDLGMEVGEFADYLLSADIDLVPIETRHALASVSPEPETRDPFDRMLLAQCKAEGFQLVTIDRALADHPFTLQY